MGEGRLCAHPLRQLDVPWNLGQPRRSRVHGVGIPLLSLDWSLVQAISMSSLLSPLLGLPPSLTAAPAWARPTAQRHLLRALAPPGAFLAAFAFGAPLGLKYSDIGTVRTTGQLSLVGF